MKGCKKIKGKDLGRNGLPKDPGQFIVVHIFNDRIWADTYRITEGNNLEIYSDYNEGDHCWKKANWKWAPAIKHTFYKAVNA